MSQESSLHDTAKNTLSVALIQLHSDSVNPDVVQEKAEKYVREAANKGAKFILLPELYNAMLPKEVLLKSGNPVPGNLSNRWSQLAKDLKIWLLAGSIAEQSATTENKLHNTALLFNDQGEILHTYRKIHTFDVNVPGKITWCESETIEKGDHSPKSSNLKVVSTPFGKIGVGICYDLRFPELFRELSLQGMDILCLPAAFNLNTGRFGHWKNLLLARAIENQCFVLAPNQVKVAANGFSCYGHSLLIDPMGKVISEGSEDNEEIVYGELDFNTLQKFREEVPSLLNRKIVY
eukprot:TRINITY_DN7222_c0_g1_i1.p1 TRINITY_DN7222_c0_g1~~TRINITY_DN7222_c0_g1_i1.p1  ORF type:complete len:320 (-),score=57.01 TRINITY_DN7222_c0_g1_i1:142-1017(-)